MAIRRLINTLQFARKYGIVFKKLGG